MRHGSVTMQKKKKLRIWKERKKLFFFECYFSMYMQSDVYNKRFSIVCFFLCSCFILFDFQNNIKHTFFKPLPFTVLCVREHEEK